MHLQSESSEETEQIGHKIGQTLRGGEVLELVSDIGGGKTTLVRGIAEGMGCSDNVSSPTFTVSKVYRAGNLQIVHCDFYRLHDPGLLSYELAESLSDSQTVTIVEWANIVQDVLPPTKITISIQALADNKRTITINTSSELSYVLKNLKNLKQEEV